MGRHHTRSTLLDSGRLPQRTVTGQPPHGPAARLKHRAGPAVPQPASWAWRHRPGSTPGQGRRGREPSGPPGVRPSRPSGPPGPTVERRRVESRAHSLVPETQCTRRRRSRLPLRHTRTPRRHGGPRLLAAPRPRQAEKIFQNAAGDRGPLAGARRERAGCVPAVRRRTGPSRSRARPTRLPGPAAGPTETPLGPGRRRGPRAATARVEGATDRAQPRLRPGP